MDESPQDQDALKRSDHAHRIAQRWEGLDARVQAKVSKLAGADRSAERRFFAQAQQASSASKRVFWLRKAADASTALAAPLAACRKGCSHCCHIAVAVSKAEAVVIAREIGVQLNEHAGVIASGYDANLQAAQEAMSARYKGQACPFLREGACSIYEHRPLACRLQMNMDEDDLLCQLVDDGDPPMVPYLNTSAQAVASAMVLGIHQAYDDIRAWFGAGEG